MGEVKGSFVRNTQKGVYELQKAVYEVLELPGFRLEPLLNLYVPETFIIGYFRDVEPLRELPRGGLMLRAEGHIYFSDAREDLMKLRNAINAESVEVVREVILPEEYVQAVLGEGRDYLEKEASLRNLVAELNVRGVIQRLQSPSA